jgi:hypothetical protein
VGVVTQHMAALLARFGGMFEVFTRPSLHYCTCTSPSFFISTLASPTVLSEKKMSLLTVLQPHPEDSLHLRLHRARSVVLTAQEYAPRSWLTVPLFQPSQQVSITLLEAFSAVLAFLFKKAHMA